MCMCESSSREMKKKKKYERGRKLNQANSLCNREKEENAKNYTSRSLNKILQLGIAGNY